MKRITILALILLPLIVTAKEQISGSSGLESVTLQNCRDAARDKADYATLRDLDQQVHDHTERLIRRQNTPDISLGGEAHYQSDAPDPAGLTDFPFEIHKLSKFQYHAGLLIQQPIYNGGTARARRKVNDVDAKLSELELQEAYEELDKTVEDIYLGIVLARKQEEIAESHISALQISLQSLKDAFSNGSAYKKDIVATEAKMLAIQAEKEGYRMRQETGASMLASVTGLPLNADTTYETPQVDNCPATRHFLEKIDLESQKLEFQQNLIKSMALPHISAFASAGYGNWPLNFFKRQPDAFVIAGVSFVVPISSWQDVAYKKKITSAQQAKLQIRRDAAKRVADAEDLRLSGEIARMDVLLEAGEQTIAKYEDLCGELRYMAECGQCPNSDYLQALEQLAQARSNQEIYSLSRIMLLLQRQRTQTK